MATIVLAGGGTGGHVYPALAIGDELIRRGHQVLYYGDPDRLEGRVAPQKGYTFRPVSALQYPRGGLLGKIRFGFGLIRAVLATRGPLKQDGVDAVLGVGGYISAPPVLAAWTLGRGAAIHEANVVPGLANQLCARVSRLILLTYERTRDRMPGGAPKHLVGVPVNPRIMEGDRAQAAAKYGLDPEKTTVLFVGGSLGAQKLNELAVAFAKDPAREVQVLHLCGPRYHEEVKAALGEVPPGVSLRDYEDRMADAYAMADLVVARSGSSTLGELCAVGKPSLLVPSPNVTENHQEENARGLESAGAAEVLVEQGWDLAAAVERVRALVSDREKLRAMGEAARSQARLDAAERAADLVEQVVLGGK
ncbi:MAG: undecaprenyldiphospho-muramoylpentapeptide beta-N-acetylglucosaminyltransferase [Alphaproteobacteria bacterium]|nr:undecaprenyldiphospho-muramoylpentapeptide beta-N-acetylglucosaminyltransferase [Alphaproteobacteria bacterium]MCB9696609.1 undecaprenyldiphospho-muramoylpentapeptide beta-N-acetylglucosaminyltransferase [Alphaproteobacteria bacterium]